MTVRQGDERDEHAFLAAYDVRAFDRPSVAVDVVLIAIANERLVTLLVRRAEHPFRDSLALPGGFLRIDESLDDAAARVLIEKVGVRDVFLEQLYTFGAVARDPRARVVSVAYYALVDPARFATVSANATTVYVELPHGAAVVLSGDAGNALTPAFDHASIVETAIRRIRGKLDYAPIGYEFLPERFTLLQLQRVHEVVAGRRFNKDSFRRRMLASNLIEPTGEMQADVGHRPAALYRYAEPA